METPADRSHAGRRCTIAVAAIILLAAAARTIFCVSIVGLHAPLKGDEIDYHALAVSVAEGSGYGSRPGEPTAGRPPLWPILLAGAYRVGGPRPETGRALAILLGTIIVPLVYAAARRAFPERTGMPLIAAAAAAINPALIFMSGYLLAENLGIALMLLFIILFSAGVRDYVSPRACLGAGILLGLGSLARPTLFPLAVAVMGALLIAGPGRAAGRLARAALMAAGVAVVIAPWAIRNDLRLGAPVLFTTHGGITFYQGNNELVLDVPSYRGGVAPLEALPGWRQILARDGEIERDREAWRLGRDFLDKNRRSAPRMALWKFARFWRFRGDMGLSGIRSGWWWDKGQTLGRIASSLDVMFLYAVAAIPLFSVGLILALRRIRELFVLYAVVLVHTATALVFHGSLRSRAPVEPVIAIFAAYAIARLFGLRRRGGRPAVETPAS